MNVLLLSFSAALAIILVIWFIYIYLNSEHRYILCKNIITFLYNLTYITAISAMAIDFAKYSNIELVQAISVSSLFFTMSIKMVIIVVGLTITSVLELLFPLTKEQEK
jgi:hypothetical protein